MDDSLTKIRHDRSLKDHPELRLEDDEYVEFVFTRSKICLWAILGATALGLIVILLAFLMILLGKSTLDDMGKHFMFIILFALLAAAVIICTIALRVYKGNKMIITNKHVMQFLMESLVSTSVNVIDLGSVEDISFKQDSLLQKIFNYGTFRLSTVGDETTYTFKYSDISSTEMKAISKLLDKAKIDYKKKIADLKV